MKMQRLINISKLSTLNYRNHILKRNSVASRANIPKSICFFFISSPFATSSSSKKQHYERRLLPYNQELCYDVVADVSSYSEFVPWVKESIIMKREPGSNIIEADLVVGFNLVNIKERYTSIVT